MPNVKNKNLRFYLDNPTHKKAWDYLQNLNKSQHGSCNNVITVAAVDYFENQEREERFISKIIERISDAYTRPNPHFITTPQTMPSVLKQTPADEGVNEYIDFDFIGG